MRRLACAVAVMVALMLVPAAAAWTWPTGGPVVRPFSLGPDAYAAGQHRGVDVQADVGEAVLAPAAGTISFAGTVPTHGFTVTIQTAGYAVSLTHLGEIAVAEGDAVAEGAVMGRAGASGVMEWPSPYVHLGIRVGSAADDYVDPMKLLPGRTVVPPPASPAPTPAPTPVPPVVTVPAPDGAVSPPAHVGAQPVTLPSSGPSVPPAEASTSRAFTPPADTTDEIAMSASASQTASPAPAAPAATLGTGTEAGHAGPAAGRPGARTGTPGRRAGARPARLRTPCTKSVQRSCRPRSRPARGRPHRSRANGAPARGPLGAGRATAAAAPARAARPEPAGLVHRRGRPAAPIRRTTRPSSGAEKHAIAWRQSAGYRCAHDTGSDDRGRRCALMSPAPVLRCAARERCGCSSICRPAPAKVSQPVRTMIGDVGAPQDPRRRGMAVRERPPAHRSCGGLRRPADIFARYHRLRGNDVLMVSGTDEHGTPIMVTADKRASPHVSWSTATTGSSGTTCAVWGSRTTCSRGRRRSTTTVSCGTCFARSGSTASSSSRRPSGRSPPPRGRRFPTATWRAPARSAGSPMPAATSATTAATSSILST